MYLSICLSVWLSVCLSIYLSMYLSISLSLPIWISKYSKRFKKGPSVVLFFACRLWSLEPPELAAEGRGATIFLRPAGKEMDDGSGVMVYLMLQYMLDTVYYYRSIDNIWLYIYMYIEVCNYTLIVFRFYCFLFWVLTLWNHVKQSNSVIKPILWWFNLPFFPPFLAYHLGCILCLGTAMLPRNVQLHFHDLGFIILQVWDIQQPPKNIS